MATFTANYNLRKPATGDLVTVAADINANMDIIDAELFEHEGRLDEVESWFPAGMEPIFFVQKPSSETITSDTNPQADNHLNYTVPSAGTYLLEWLLILEGADAGDFKGNIAWTGTMEINGYSTGLPTGAATLSEFSRVEVITLDLASPTNNFQYGTLTGSTTLVSIHVVVEVTVAGTITLQWAQNTSSATGTQVREGSWLKAQKVKA